MQVKYLIKLQKFNQEKYNHTYKIVWFFKCKIIYSDREGDNQLKLTLLNDISNVYQIKSMNYDTGLNYSVLQFNEY